MADTKQSEPKEQPPKEKTDTLTEAQLDELNQLWEQGRNQPPRMETPPFIKTVKAKRN